MKRILRAACLFPLILIAIPFHVGHEGAPVRQDMSRFRMWLVTKYEHLGMRMLHYLGTRDWIYRYRVTTALVERLRDYLVASGNGEVLTLDEAREMLDSLAKGGYTIAIGTCPCRRALRKYSTEVPNDTDMVFGPWAEQYLRIYPDIYREIEYAEAVELVEDFEKHGLVHQVYGIKTQEGGGTVICNCNRDVCVPMLAQRIRGYEAFRKGRSRAIINSEECIGVEECGACIGRCAFDARVVREGKVEVDPEACFGCGICVSTCRGKASSLERVPGRELIYAKRLVS